MKSLKIFLTVVFGAACAYGQTAYRVPADSKGNSIVLTVANESRSTTAQKVSVQLLGHHPGLTFSPTLVTLKMLQSSGSSDVAFAFAVGRDVKLNSRDTLNFQIRDDAGETWTKSIVVEYAGPQEYKLDQNFPNPFNPVTTIYYDLPADSRVSISVYDILGREVTKLLNETKEAGYYSAILDAHNLASGAYIYRMVAQPIAGGKAFTNIKKMMVLR